MMDIDEYLIDSLILVPQFEAYIEPEIEYLNDMTHFWLWGDVDTSDYLDVVNDVIGDVDSHLDTLELALKNA
jgi:hypothetical protein